MNFSGWLTPNNKFISNNKYGLFVHGRTLTRHTHGKIDPDEATGQGYVWMNEVGDEFDVELLPERLQDTLRFFRHNIPDKFEPKELGITFINQKGTVTGSKTIKVSEIVESTMKLKDILEDINVPLKKGDTVLVGKFKNHPIEVKKIGKGDDDMPTINDKPAVKFRLPKKEGRVKLKDLVYETPVFKDGPKTFDLHIEKYKGMNVRQKKDLLRAYNSDMGVSGYSKKYDSMVTFKQTGPIMMPKGGMVQIEPSASGPPMSNDVDMGSPKRLPEYWEQYVEGDY